MPGRVGARARGSSLTQPRAPARSSCTEAARGTGTTLSALKTAAVYAVINWGQGGKTNQTRPGVDKVKPKIRFKYSL